MLRGVSFLSFLISISLFARVSIDIEYKTFEKNKKVSFEKKIEVFLDEVRTLIIPKSNQIFEIRLSERNIPQAMEDEEISIDEVVIEIKLFELKNDEKILMSSPKIITVYGHPASFEISDVSKNNKPGKRLMSLKLNPKIIN